MKSTFVVAAIIASAVLGALIVRQTNETPVATILPGPHVQSATGTAAPSRRVEDLPQYVAQAMAKAMQISEQIDKLIATGSPDDAMKAYSLVAKCIEVEELGTLIMTADEVKNTTRFCSGLTQRMRMSRIDYVAIAAKARVKGASTAFYREGPFGDPTALDTRPDDPLVVEWKKVAISQLHDASDVDISSLMTLSMQYRYGKRALPKDLTLSLGYLTALKEVEPTRQDGGIDNPFSDESLRALKEGMTPEQVTAATLAAHDIVANWRRAHTNKKSP